MLQLFAESLVLYTSRGGGGGGGGGGGCSYMQLLDLSTLKTPNKNCSRRHFNFYFYLSKKIRLDFICESSA